MAKLCIIVPRMFFFADQSAEEERQPGSGHQQHERCGHQHPRVVARALRILHGLLQNIDLCLGCGS